MGGEYVGKNEHAMVITITPTGTTVNVPSIAKGFNFASKAGSDDVFFAFDKTHTEITAADGIGQYTLEAEESIGSDFRFDNIPSHVGFICAAGKSGVVKILFV